MIVEDTAKKSSHDKADFSVPAAVTDTGCERELNEDRYAVVESESGVTWIVCDGMGGSAGGELAAQLAIDAIRRDLESQPARASDVALHGAILEANRIIVLRRQNPAFSGMGTTVVAAHFFGSELGVGLAGDSRAYLIRDGAIQQLTTDHTFVQGLVDKGEITAEQALSHPQSHVLTRCIGSEPALDVDVRRFWLWETSGEEPQDFLLLCSDGLYSLVSEPEMANAVTQYPPQESCVRLVELAKNRGGYDNITVAVVPLPGQLKNDPPLGYNERRAEKARAAVRARGQVRPGMSAVRFSLLLIMLCGLAAVIAVFIVVFMVRS